jgi:hypothetical protein
MVPVLTRHPFNFVLSSAYAIMRDTLISSSVTFFCVDIGTTATSLQCATSPQDLSSSIGYRPT